MPTTSNQKLKLMHLMRILLDKTDENHAMTINDLISELAKYDIKAERKSLYSDIELLREFGIDIERRKTKTFEYYVASRQFELAELKLLVDAVQSSRFMTVKKSEELIKKLSSLTNIYQAKTLQRQVFVANRPKSINENIYYNVDTIHIAINQKKKITFQYFDYNMKKEKTLRKDGELYCVTPLALCWNDDKYYLVSDTMRNNSLVHYRVDRMCAVEVSEEIATSDNAEQFNIADYTKKVFGMFSGEVVKARLSFDKSLVNVVLDKFGADVRISGKKDTFEISVDVSNSPVFLGWIFQFGAKAEILEPESLINSMKDLINQNSGKYF